MYETPQHLNNHSCFLATPGPPYALTVVDVTKRHVELKWEAPKNDGGRPIQRLVIRKLH